MATFCYWNAWCESTSVVTTAANTTVWATWMDTGTSTAVTNAATVWVNWISVNSTSSTVLTIGPAVPYAPYVDQRTPEEKAAYEARLAIELAEVQRKADLAATERRAAIAKARALLLSMLSLKQREQYERERFFDVIARASRRRYRIRQGTHGNVRLLNEQGQEVASYCGQPHGVPDEDAMLAQALMLEHAEEDFLKVANRGRVPA